ncbi:hypothetical protein ACI797_11455 [Geodermatophilus sp. SYSU D00691]
MTTSPDTAAEAGRGVARWLPPTVLDAPGPDVTDPTAGVRLLELLLRAVDGQRALLEADIDTLWDDLFIESCADWVVPYLGALLGLPSDAERAEVAFAIALRRRKGTPAALEDFAFVLTGLTARVVEGWQVTTWAQHLGHAPPLRPAALDLREPAAHRVGRPFEQARRSVRPDGPWAPAAVTAVVWPWQVRTLVDTQATALPGTRRFALHPLGVPAPLYLRPRPPRVAAEGDAEGRASRTGDETDAPVRATYAVLQALAAPGEITYGSSLALATTHPLASAPDEDPRLIRVTVGGSPVPWDRLRFGSLPPGAAAPASPGADQVVVDVNRGSVELGSALRGTPTVTWHRAVPGTLGALASTGDADPRARVVVEVRPDGTVPDLAAAFTAGEQRSVAAGLSAADSTPGVPDVEIRLLTAGRLAAPPAQTFTPTLPRWRIVAPPLMTPVVDGNLSLDLPGARVELDGFFLLGDLVAGARLAGLELTGLTMHPGRGRLLVDATAWELALSARACILGPIRAELSALPVELTDCVVDGRGHGFDPCGPDTAPAGVDAVAARVRFGPALTADGVTFAGPVRVDAVNAVDCLFADGIDVVQQQQGCLRHCHLGPPLSTPPRLPVTYRCGPFEPPTFVSVAFDAAGYFCLELEPDVPLLSGASDGGEIGAYHRTRRAARVRRLRRRIDEFVPLGMTAEVTVADWEER